MSDQSDHSSGAGVDGDGDDDCTLTAMTLYSGTLQGRLHVCISRVGGSVVCIYAVSIAGIDTYTHIYIFMYKHSRISAMVF